MHLRRRPFWWQWRCADAIRSASPDAAWTELNRKPPDAAIGRLLALYCPSSHLGDNQHNNNATCTHFAGRFDGHHVAAVLYRAHHPMEEVCGFLKATKLHHQASTRSDITQPDMPKLVVSDILSWKRAPVDMLAPNNNRGMTYQTDEKNFNSMVEYSVGVVKLAHYFYITRFLWHVI